MNWPPPLGAFPHADGVVFRVWAPRAGAVTLVLEPNDGGLPMQPLGEGYYEVDVPRLRAGARYRYSLDGQPPFPDPASRFQPEGIHGPSMVVDPTAYTWHDGNWAGCPPESLVFYELHVGTFSPEGTFAGVTERLGYLADLGVTAVELMPVADFPGRWNWGYDPAALFAPSRAYGTPDALRALVDAAHQEGLAVFLDVIYNHLGPDGAYVAVFAPMFTDKHHTPWGQAINLDDTHSDGVRHFFRDNALHWLREYHLDGLRLDATHALKDDRPTHFLAELAHTVAGLEEGPRRWLVAEDHRNLNRLILPLQEGGYGLDAVWADDFHHQIRNLTAGDTEGYYADFSGTTMRDVAETLNQGWFFDGTRRTVTDRPLGTDASPVRPEQCVICVQNHDQIGNRPGGDRLTDSVSPAVWKAVTAILLFAPELPLLFMGQEWSASTPFQFFTDHNAALGALVTAGRKKEFAKFAGFQQHVPDPQDPDTFLRSKLNWQERAEAEHAPILRFYKACLRLRKSLRGKCFATPLDDQCLRLVRGRHVLLAAVAGEKTMDLPHPAEVLLDSELPEYAAAPRPPHLAHGRVTFATAGALIARLPAP